MEVLIMAVEAIKGAGMTYQGSTSTAEVKSEAKPKIEASEQVEVSEQLARSTSAIDTKATGEGDGGAQSQNQTPQDAAVESNKEQIRKAVEEINKKANNSEAIFGIHEATNRVTIKLVDKETKEVIKELPAEKTLDMIAKIWEMAGILVDEKR
jgi:flagellar protein FlaG